MNLAIELVYMVLASYCQLYCTILSFIAFMKTDTNDMHEMRHEMYIE